MHDGFTSKISFTHKERKIIFCLVTPQQVRDDELKMKRKKTEEENSKKERKY